jgi:hypothetical protein
MLEFRFEDFLEEIDSFKSSAQKFLDPYEASRVLDQYKAALKALRERHNEKNLPAWEIPRDYPLKTKISKGMYEPGNRRGRHHVQAWISCKWNIRPTVPKKRALPDTFVIVGLASSRVELFDCCSKTEETLESLGSWRMELGTTDVEESRRRTDTTTKPKFPGCFFHLSVLGEKTGAEEVFPKTLSVPRFPSVIFSPIAVTEFVLGELFPDEWAHPARHAQPDSRRLASIQRRRFTSILQWQLDEVKNNHASAPWVVLKRSAPRANLFIQK